MIVDKRFRLALRSKTRALSPMLSRKRRKEGHRYSSRWIWSGETVRREHGKGDVVEVKGTVDEGVIEENEGWMTAERRIN